ncbi:MAG: hypothetical protein KatS3mg081_1551 [Gemmatimonadales bacterium]|nr:MAG: hypothetical protein KatS3mg081_1551 [Gemmatimonadales bacterium]
MAADDSYVFGAAVLRGGVGAEGDRYVWRVDLAAPVLLGLPDSAVAPSPQGQLGLGATYQAENAGHKVGLVVKEAFAGLRWGQPPVSTVLRLGRFAFGEGHEISPPGLESLKRERIAERLVGPFDFSHVGRSFDGLEVNRSDPRTSLTAAVLRPTEGVFQLDGLRPLDVMVAYAGLTRVWTRKRDREPAAGSWEGRLFALYYLDWRRIPRADNRPAELRVLDSTAVRIFTIGMHYLAAFRAGPGVADVLLWGAWQNGGWGQQRHRAAAVAMEGGFRPRGVPLNPWLRGGWFYGQGDRDPSDDFHRTFFQVLPTPRIYARFPFYNLTNLVDRFFQLTLRLGDSWRMRLDAHSLRLAAKEDLWYSGGGAFDRENFGFVGRSSGGSSDLAGVFDLSTDWQATPRLGATLYVGHARGGDVIGAVYPRGQRASFAYLELRCRL